MVICVGAVCTIKPHVCMLYCCFGQKMTAKISPDLKIQNWSGISISGGMIRGQVLKGSG